MSDETTLERGECRWWLMERHQWSKWYEIDTIKHNYRTGTSYSSVGQERKCFRCGYREREM